MQVSRATAGVTYGRLLRPGQRPGVVVYAEKLREDRPRGQGLAVVCWTWSGFDDVAERIRTCRTR
jgi:hypothetical protein